MKKANFNGTFFAIYDLEHSETRHSLCTKCEDLKDIEITEEQRILLNVFSKNYDSVSKNIYGYLELKKDFIRTDYIKLKEFDFMKVNVRYKIADLL